MIQNIFIATEATSSSSAALDGLVGAGTNIVRNNTSNTKKKKCNILALIPGHRFDPNPPEEAVWGYHGLDLGYSHLAGALLALDRLQNRPETVLYWDKSDENQTLKSLSATNTSSDVVSLNCNIDFDVNMIDTGASTSATNRKLMGITSTNTKPCAMVGPFVSEPAFTAINFASGWEIPIGLHGAHDYNVRAVKNNPTVYSTSINYYSMADAIVNWLVFNNRTDYLFTLGPQDEVGIQYRDVLGNSARHEQKGNFTRYETLVFARGGDYEPNKGFGYAMQKIHHYGFRNVFFAFHDSGPHESALEKAASFAELYGLNNGDHFWMINGEIDLHRIVRYVNQANNTNVTKMVNGMSAIQQIDGFLHDPQQDFFLKEWKTQNQSFVDRVNQLYPLSNLSLLAGEDGGNFSMAPPPPGFFRGNPDYFQTHLPRNGAGRIYDAVLSTAIGMCRQQADEKAGIQREQEEKKCSSCHTPWRYPVYDHILDTQFQGASGLIDLRGNYGRSTSGWGQPGTRQSSSAMYGAYNFRINPQTNQMEVVLTHTLDRMRRGFHNPENRMWEPTDAGAPFIYANNSTRPNPLNRRIPDQNYLSTGVRAGGLACMSLVLVMAVLSGIFLFKHKDKSVVKGKQPIYTFVLLVGICLTITAIIPLSLDEGVNIFTSPDQLDAACSSVPWLVALGYNIIYQGLFCKLWRINKVLQFRRNNKVTPLQVAAPLFVALLVNVIVLIVWQTVDPLMWHRIVVDEFTDESVGACMSNDSSLPYIITLGALMLASTVGCGYMAYRCVDVTEQISESKNIFSIIFVQFQVFVVGVPILVALNGESSTEATFLGRSLLLFVFCFTTLLLLMVPMMKGVYLQDKKDKGHTNSTTGSSRTSNTRGNLTLGGGGNVRVSGLSNPLSSSGSNGMGCPHCNGRGVYNAAPSRPLGEPPKQLPANRDREITSSSGQTDQSTHRHDSDVELNTHAFHTDSKESTLSSSNFASEEGSSKSIGSPTEQKTAPPALPVVPEVEGALTASPL